MIGMRFLTLTALCLAPIEAAVVYDNTANDSLETIFFSTGPHTEIGDRATLGGTERLSTEATVQFYNAGVDGSFDAVLRFYLVGAPVGAQLGSDYLLTNQFAPAGGVFDLAFSNVGLLVPDEFVFTIELLNVGIGLDLGLNLFDPPNSPGSSSTEFLMVRGSQFSEISAGTNSNLYFRLEAEDSTSPVPEPSTLFLTGVAAVLFLLKIGRVPMSEPHT